MAKWLVKLTHGSRLELNAALGRTPERAWGTSATARRAQASRDTSKRDYIAQAHPGAPRLPRKMAPPDRLSWPPLRASPYPTSRLRPRVPVASRLRPRVPVEAAAASAASTNVAQTVAAGILGHFGTVTTPGCLQNPRGRFCETWRDSGRQSDVTGIHFTNAGKTDHVQALSITHTAAPAVGVRSGDDSDHRPEPPRARRVGRSHDVLPHMGCTCVCAGGGGGGGGGVARAFPHVFRIACHRNRLFDAAGMRLMSCHAVVVPFLLGFASDAQGGVAVINHIVDAIFIADFIMNWFTGIQLDNGLVEMDQVESWGTFDLI